VNELSKEKKEWLESIGVIDISAFNFLTPTNGHLYSIEYLMSKSLEELKQEYALLYSKGRNNNCFCNFCNQVNR